MKSQFHFLSYVDGSGLQMFSDKFFNIYSHEFKMFFQIFVSKGDTGQFFGEKQLMNSTIFINKPSKLWFYFNSEVCFRGMRTDLST